MRGYLVAIVVAVVMLSAGCAAGPVTVASDGTSRSGATGTQGTSSTSLPKGSAPVCESLRELARLAAKNEAASKNSGSPDLGAALAEVIPVLRAVQRLAPEAVANAAMRMADTYQHFLDIPPGSYVSGDEAERTIGSPEILEAFRQIKAFAAEACGVEIEDGHTGTTR